MSDIYVVSRLEVNESYGDCSARAFPIWAGESAAACWKKLAIAGANYRGSDNFLVWKFTDGALVKEYSLNSNDVLSAYVNDLFLLD
jgi:hypothetical protein